MPPTRRTQRRAATIQATRLAGAPTGRVPPAVGWPHRWQKRAWGDNSARQKAQARAARLAPQLLQKLPEAAAPHAGQGLLEVASVMKRSVNESRVASLEPE